MVLLLGGCDNADHSATSSVTTHESAVQPTSVAPSVSKKRAIKQMIVDAGSDAGKKPVRRWPRLISQRKALPSAWDHNPSPSKRKDLSTKCPAEMVNVADKFCVDRYEASIFSGKHRVSPFYHPSQNHSRALFNLWQTKFAKHPTAKGLTMPIPKPDLWQLSAPFKVQAVSKGGATPNGYTNLRIAKEACEAVGKRVCNPAEWKKACRGEQDTQFPYGDHYKRGLCNVFRFTHPISVLHKEAADTKGSNALNDPRLNMVKDEQGNPLLRKTGSHKTCASKWGDDAAYDMVGNLDEWVNDPGGRFLGGFYARNTKKGCETGISSHPASYFDYSLGVRCCRDLMVRVLDDPYED